MDLTLLVTLVFLAASAHGVPPEGPKFVPVFVSSDAINRLQEKERGLNGNQPEDEAGHDVTLNQRSLNGDYDRTEPPSGYNGPAPVYEHQPHDHGMHQTQPQYTYQGNQPAAQYQMSQPQQSYQIVQPAQIQQSGQYQPPYQIVQQPAPIQQPYQINQQPGQIQQPILLAPVAQTGGQPMYVNQQQMGQPLNNQQPILLNQQQLVPNQPMQTYQQQQPILISQPMVNQQTVLTQPNGQHILVNQPPLQNQAILLQPNQNPQPIVSGASVVNPVLAQPGTQVSNQNGNVYAVVPINQNAVPNQNTNTYLVPVQQVQQLPQQMYAVNAGK